MTDTNYSTPTHAELLAYCDARLKITVDHYAFYKKFSADMKVIVNEINMLQALRNMVIEKMK